MSKGRGFQRHSFIYFVILVTKVIFTSGHNCVHDHVVSEAHRKHGPPVVSHHVKYASTIDAHEQLVVEGQDSLETIEDNTIDRRRRLAQGSFESIRITLDYGRLDVANEGDFACFPGDADRGKTVQLKDGQVVTCSRDDELTTEKEVFLRNILKDSAEWWSTALSVEPVVGNLRLSSRPWTECDYVCCEPYLPSDDQTVGRPNSDIILYITTRPTTDNVVAWAISCQRDSLGRPIAGHINFSPAQLKLGNRDRNRQFSTALHEMAHVLGFSASHYGHFRDPTTGILKGSVTSEFVERGTIVTKITTQTVKQKVQELFNCNLGNIGLELENFGGAGSQGSHWEKRLVNNEFMSATISMNPVRSAFTLALFEDMGWYSVNYAQAEVLPWGLESGCNFLHAKCDSWDDSYFCNDKALTGCTVDHTAKAYCALTTYASAIPSPYRYFDSDVSTGGRDRYLDFCPHYQGYSNGDCRDLGYSETYLSSVEVAGDSSRCFVSNGAPHCFETACASTQELRVRVLSTWRTCPPEGGSVSFPGGRLVECPRASEVCGAEYFCNAGQGCSGAGTCNSDGSCECYSGRTGPGCSELLCPSSLDEEECSTGLVCADDLGLPPGSSCCQRTSGVCTCEAGYTGLACEDLLCPSEVNAKVCSGHGSCVDGTCQCDNSYTGLACSDVPGCRVGECGESLGQGACDTNTGACACSPGQHGAQCDSAGVPEVVELPVQVGNVTTFNATVGAKEMTFFSASLNGTTYDITVRVTSYDGDCDVYAVYVDPLAANQGETLVLPTTKAATWASTNSARVNKEDIIHLCGTYFNFPRGEGATRCTIPDPNFSNDFGILYVGVLGFEFNKTTSFGISVEQEACVKVECGTHGVCEQGECICDELWIGATCDIPNCPGTPDCFNHGDCVILEGKSDPECLCSFGFDGDDCSSIAPGFENPPVALPVGGTSGLVQNQSTLLVGTGYGNWSYFEITVPANQTELSSMYVTVNERLIDECPDPSLSGVFSSDGCGKGDPVLVAQRNVLPSLTEYSSFDVDSWTISGTSHQLLLDSSTGLVPGTWYVGIYNSAYARSRLYYDLNVDTRGRCPPSLACSGHGSCDPGASSKQPACECESQNGVTYVGDTCHASYTTLDMSEALDSESTAMHTLQVGEWNYFAVEVAPETIVPMENGTQRELTVSMQTLPRLGEDEGRVDKFTDQPLLVLSLGNSIPSLASPGHIDFDGWSGRSRRQSITLRQPTLKSKVYFFGVHNRHYSSFPVNVAVSVSLAVPLNSTATQSCIPQHDPNVGACHGRGTCVSDESVPMPYCFCKGTWSGDYCNNPSLGAISALQQAAQLIDNLCNTCSLRVTLAKDEYRIFRIPQALRASQGIRIYVAGTNATSNEPAGNADVYVSEQLPRSAYDFVNIASGDGANETIVLSEPSTSGRYFMAVYAREEMLYQITVDRISIQDSDESIIDINVVDALGKWLTRSPAGQATLAIIVVVSTAIMASGMFVVFRQTGIVDKTRRGLGSVFGLPVVAEAVE